MTARAQRPKSSLRSEDLVEALLIASAHEILTRSPYRFGSVAEHHAAAAGFLAWHKAKRAQAIMGAAMIGPADAVAIYFMLGARHPKVE